MFCKPCPVTSTKRETRALADMPTPQAYITCPRRRVPENTRANAKYDLLPGIGTILLTKHITGVSSPAEQRRMADPIQSSTTPVWRTLARKPCAFAGDGKWQAINCSKVVAAGIKARMEVRNNAFVVVCLCSCNLCTWS